MPSYVVAGASRGLGLEFVVQLLSGGNTVIALARDPSAKSLVAIKDSNLHILKADITDPDALKAAAEETARITGGSLDVLINNAAYTNRLTAFLDVTQFPDTSALLADFNTSFSTNVLGPTLTTNAFLPLLKKGTLKKVLTLSSGMGDPEMNLKAGISNQVAYCVSKSALEMINVKFALALKDEGFTFLAISPGLVNTQEGIPPPEIMPHIVKMVQSFKSVYPDWSGVPLETPESVGFMLDILDKVTPEDSGKFISHKGNKEWL
ncbi:NAD-P-binding protein [Stereum hirsutum FP-91666 SS1]|uniref:NAD-P-binding protein n=1 Tax=Stereum hirsutum (strain FP-91666) TaxID=721885 RepID=UPI000444A354|nr:NAD-P-binding protein [Stereum hirsutum FP-91666 SS1]EIM84670.1 NAD-P-binding protein [Stereum hirsutum FP-91666 SS1]